MCSATATMSCHSLPTTPRRAGFSPLTTLACGLATGYGITLVRPPAHFRLAAGFAPGVRGDITG